MSSEISLPGCNLYLDGSRTDRNGNKVVKLSFPTGRGFTIQTNGNLPNTHRILRSKKTKASLSKLTVADLRKISGEVCRYVKKYGSTTQKRRLRTY